MQFTVTTLYFYDNSEANIHKTNILAEFGKNVQNLHKFCTYSMVLLSIYLNNIY